MTPHGRKYGEKDSHPMYVWNGLLEAKHREKIGPALWEFLWCIDRITFEKVGKGYVLGGAPVSFKKIAIGFGVDEQTIRAHFRLLEKWKYIDRTRTPRGYSPRVRNSAKFTRKAKSDREETPDHSTEITEVAVEKTPITRYETPDHSLQNPRSNKSKQLEKAVEQAGRCPDVWKFLGVSGSRLPAQVQEICANLYQSKNGQTPVDLIAVCMDGIQALGEHIPQALAQRATELRSQPKTNVAEPLPELGAPAWANV